MVLITNYIASKNSANFFLVMEIEKSEIGFVFQLKFLLPLTADYNTSMD